MDNAELFWCDYPLYTILNIGNGEVAVAGGGGEAKTGVPNGIELYYLHKEDGTHRCISRCILQYDMGSDLIMNMIHHPKDDVIATGLGHSLQLFRVHRQGSKQSRDSEAYLSKMVSVRTDFKDEQSYQKVVVFNYDGTLIVTGGSDCVVRVWKYPALQKKLELREHGNEIEHIAAHFASNEFVSVCCKGEALVCDASQGKLLKRFSWKSHQYRIKSCCYSPKKDREDKYWLYSCNVPLKLSKNSSKTSYILKWSTTSWKVQKCAMLKQFACAMNVNSSGLKLAVGTNEGSIYVFDNCLKVMNIISGVHSVFITGLTFVDVAIHGSTKKELDDEIILSVSVGKSCCASVASRKGHSSAVRLCSFLSFLIVLSSILYILMFII